MAIKVPKGAGSKLGRTETVSIRLDPRLNYLCELAARSQRRTKSSFIESMLAEQIQTLVINKWREPGYGDPSTFGDAAETLWHVRESQRLVSLALIAPELMTFEEQHVWALIEENGYFWLGRWEKERWKFSTDLGSIVRDRVDECWDDLLAVAVGEKSADVLPKVTEKSGKPEHKRDIDDEIPF
ncbi:hypothetical protein [Tropicibacter naphthalenivorans]|uniref:Uncharacterized protein n=1 Tax=Tropicibacter naphthalenivorans TaxID=441103 RepID=A0A0P1GKJ0_9RHOB|nr:hypothetical protein [Tropicibacter naphthalenivorans]CUH82415.1 hypothetical protein TRN7648_03955 [Tropicibacter naphthalenivorans]SMD06363.1 hypothetical protein SAMN04488093_11447 [Tropicibacter naphthalenivorans]